MSNNWFSVDKEGLGRLLQKRGKSFAIFELIQNAWDTNAREAEIVLEKLPGRPFALLRVSDDDPEGFANIAHAYTLFADSVKKDDPTKRGRFNFGEKLVLALCKEALIKTTKGTVTFYEDGRRIKSRDKTESGSICEFIIRMTQAEYDECCTDVHRLIPPIPTTFNGVPLTHPEPLCSFVVKLPTVKSDDEGNLSRTVRKTTVEIYERWGDGEAACIYEMGIPVVETGDRYHINVQQKVPMTLDRANVPPAYLRRLRAEVLNHVHDRLTPEEASETWVTDAVGHKDISHEAVQSAMEARFGEKRAVFDLSDTEANNRLTSKGYNIIAGGTFGKSAWDNIKAAGALVPSGKIDPTMKPYDPSSDKTVDIVPEVQWTENIHCVVTFAKWLAKELMRIDLKVRIVRTTSGFSACYGRGHLDLNLFRLGHRWFQGWDLERIVDLLIHEFGHQYAGNHLSEDYYHALTKLAGKVAVLALEQPEGFSKERYTRARVA